MKLIRCLFFYFFFFVAIFLPSTKIHAQACLPNCNTPYSCSGWDRGAQNECTQHGGRCDNGLCVAQNPTITPLPTALPTATDTPKPPTATPLPTATFIPTPTLGGQPSIPPTIMAATSTPGIACTIGNSSVCQTGFTCRCGPRPDDVNCAKGNCYEGFIQCSATHNLPCIGDQDCTRECGGGNNLKCNVVSPGFGYCVDKSVANPDPQCGQGNFFGASCHTEAECLCGIKYTNTNCKNQGQVCCVATTCPTSTPQPTPVTPNNPDGDVFSVRPCDIGSGKGIQTAVGCLPTDPGPMASTLIKLAIGIAGGIAFLLIIFGGLHVLTSAGNPEAMNEGKEIVTSAIVGLLLIILSIFILHVVGVDILGIPGFR